MTIAAIDADSIVYKACFIAEKTVYDIVPKDKHKEGMVYEDYQKFLVQTFRLVKEYKAWLKENKKTEDDFVRISRTELQPLAYALQIIGTMLRSIINAIGAEQNFIYISGDTNFREDIAVMREYKESRKKKVKPVYYKPARDYLLNSWNAIQVEGEEADDAVAQMVTSCELDDQLGIIATIDKDLLTVPGWKYNYDKQQFIFVTEKEAAYNFYTQLLVGDKGDDIVGVPGIGPAGAKTLLDGCNTVHEMYRIALEQYQKAFRIEETQHNKKLLGKVGEKVLRENAQLLHMRRFKGEVWTPPKQE